MKSFNSSFSAVFLGSFAASLVLTAAVSAYAAGSDPVAPELRESMTSIELGSLYPVHATLTENELKRVIPLGSGGFFPTLMMGLAPIYSKTLTGVEIPDASPLTRSYIFNPDRGQYPAHILGLERLLTQSARSATFNFDRTKNSLAVLIQMHQLYVAIQELKKSSWLKDRSIALVVNSEKSSSIQVTEGADRSVALTVSLADTDLSTVFNPLYGSSYLDADKKKIQLKYPRVDMGQDAMVVRAVTEELNYDPTLKAAFIGAGTSADAGIFSSLAAEDIAIQVKAAKHSE